MANLELRLFGVPRLTVDGEEVVISRPRVFECLARIIVAGPKGITRSELCRQIWPNFETSDARSQLRGTLMKLRAELEKFGVAEYFDLTSESLVVAGVTCDYIKFTQSGSYDLAELKLAGQPLAKCWDEENWREESNCVADALASAFQAVKAKDGLATLDLLRKAVHSHPTSTCLADLLIKRLEGLNRIDEANQVIIAFEDAWVDRFGNTDLPKLSLRPSLGESAPLGSDQKTGRVKVVAYLGIGGVAVLAALMSSMSLKSSPNKDLSSYLMILTHKQETKLAKTFAVVQFSSGDSRVSEITRFADGGVSVHTTQDKSVQDNIIETDGRLTPGLPYPKTLVDRLGTSTVVRESLRSIVFSDGRKSLRISGSADFPILGDMKLLIKGRVFVRRVSDDPFYSHHETFIADTIGNQEPVQPTGPQPQVVYPTFVFQNELFLKYSAGRKEGWHYHAGVYNLTTDKFETLPYANVVYKSLRGTLVVLPQVTDIKNGDYNTHWDGTVQLVRPDQKPVSVSISGVNQFESISCFADSLILVTSHTSASFRLQVVPIDGGAPIFDLPHEVADQTVSPDCKALLWRTYDPKRDSNSYILIDVVNGL